MLELILFLAVISSAFQYCLGKQDATRILSLAEAVQLALNQNPNVQIAMISSSLAKQEQRRALAALLPHASVGASEAVNRINVESAFGTTAGFFPQHEGPFQVITAGTQFNAPVFNAALLEYYRAEQSNHTASLADAKTAREQMVQLVVNQYLLCLRLESTARAEEAQVALAQRLFDQATHLEEAGASAGLDTLRANQKLKTQQQALLVAREEAQTGLYELIHLLNLPPATTLTLSDSEVVTAQDTLARAYDDQISALFKVNQARADLARSVGRIEETYRK